MTLIEAFRTIKMPPWLAQLVSRLRRRTLQPPEPQTEPHEPQTEPQSPHADSLDQLVKTANERGRDKIARDAHADPSELSYGHQVHKDLIADAIITYPFGGPEKTPLPEYVPAIRAETQKKEVLDVSGQFRFKDDILDQLEFFMKMMKRLKRTDRVSYDYFSKVGINMVPDRIGQSRDEWPFPEAGSDISIIDPWFIKTLPMAGAVSIGSETQTRKDNDKAEVCEPRIYYFAKFMRKGLADVQFAPQGHAVYHLTAVFESFMKDKERKGKFKAREDHAAVGQIAVAVSPEGKLTALRMRRQIRHTIKQHRNRRNAQAAHASTGKHFAKIKNGGTVIERAEWRIPEWLEPDKSLPTYKPDGKTLEERACGMFKFIAGSYRQLNTSMIRVSVRKDQVTAVLNVDVLRTPYFFRDRIPVIDARGVKQRIFHIVRPHERQQGNKVANVKMHFRGLREFVWNGYNVLITVPGRDHRNWTEAPLEGYELESKYGQKHKDTPAIDWVEIADMIDGDISGTKTIDQWVKEHPEVKPNGDAAA